MECKKPGGDTYTETYVPLAPTTTYAADNWNTIQNLLNAEDDLSVLAGAYNPPFSTCFALNCSPFGGGGTLFSQGQLQQAFQAAIVNELDQALFEAGIDPQTAQCLESKITSGRSWVGAILGALVAKGIEGGEAFDPATFAAGAIVGKFVEDHVECR